MLKAVCLGVFAVLLLCGTLTAATGPIDQGSLYLNGTVFFQSQSGDLWERGTGNAMTTYGAGNSSINFTEAFEVSPAVGYFVSPGLFVGGQVAVLGYKQGDNKLTAVALGPSIGYFFNVDQTRTEVKGSIYPYVRGFFNWGHWSNNSTLTILQYGGKAGLMYMLSGAVALDGGVKFQGDSWKQKGATDSVKGTTISVGLGISAFIY